MNNIRRTEQDEGKGVEYTRRVGTFISSANDANRNHDTEVIALQDLVSMKSSPKLCYRMLSAPEILGMCAAR